MKVDNRKSHVFEVSPDFGQTLRVIGKEIDKYPESDRYGLEIAGRDSIAACLKFLKNYRQNNGKKILIVPISILHYGFPEHYWNPQMIQHNISYLRDLILRDNVIVLDPVIYDYSEAFKELILRNMGIVQKRYSVYTPCVPCHLFFHLFRVPILQHFKIGSMITGERIKHDKRTKLNQQPEILEFFKAVMGDLGIDLIQPLKNIVQNHQIEEIIDDYIQKFESVKGSKFQKEIIKDSCIFSKNMQDENGDVVFLASKFLTQLKEYYYPLMLSYLENQTNL